MQINFDVDAILEMKDLNVLTWEIIEARGIAAGDLMALWDVACGMGESVASCMEMMDMWSQPDENGEVLDIYRETSEAYRLLASFLARDAREIVKFLHSRRFKFPEGRTGPRPDDARGF